jgi:hypothetical protein
MTEKHIHSDAELDKLISWSSGLESLLIIDSDRIDFVGSHKRKGDLYEHTKEFYGGDGEPRPIGPHAVLKGHIAIFNRSVREGGDLIFPRQIVKVKRGGKEKEVPSGISKGFINRLRRNDPERYHAQYGNSPKGVGLNTFRIEDVRYFRFDGDFVEARYKGELVERINKWSLNRIIVYDPSVAERKKSSQQAIHVLGKGDGHNRYVLESIVGHFTPDIAIEHLFELDKKWHPDFISIETRAFQGSLKYTIPEMADLKGIHVPSIVEWPPQGSPKGQWAKTEHIRGLQPLIRNHFLWVQDDQEELLTQIEFYPKVRWDDALDALAQGLDYWPLAMSEEEVGRRKSAEEEFLTAATGVPARREVIQSSGEREWDEAAFLRQFGPTGYSLHRN